MQPPAGASASLTAPSKSMDTSRDDAEDERLPVAVRSAGYDANLPKVVQFVTAMREGENLNQTASEQGSAEHVAMYEALEKMFGGIMVARGVAGVTRQMSAAAARERSPP